MDPMLKLAMDMLAWQKHQTQDLRHQLVERIARDAHQEITRQQVEATRIKVEIDKEGARILAKAKKEKARLVAKVER